MPKLNSSHLPHAVVSHLQQRVRERLISREDLLRLGDWVNSDPDVPEGDWYKDFGSFKLVGSGPLPVSILGRDMFAWGAEVR